MAASTDSEEVRELTPVILEMMYMLSDEKPRGRKISVTSLRNLLGLSGEKWKTLDLTLEFLSGQQLIDLRRTSRGREDLVITERGVAYLFENIVSDEDKSVYRILGAYIDAVTPKPFFRLKLARMLRLILKKGEARGEDFEEQLEDFLLRGELYESNEWLHRFALEVAKDDRSPVMMRCLGGTIDRLFETSYTGTYFKSHWIKRPYLYLWRFYASPIMTLKSVLLMALFAVFPIFIYLVLLFPDNLILKTIAVLSSVNFVLGLFWRLTLAYARRKQERKQKSERA